MFLLGRRKDVGFRYVFIENIKRTTRTLTADYVGLGLIGTLALFYFFWEDIERPQCKDLLKPDSAHILSCFQGSLEASLHSKYMGVSQN